MTPVPKFIFLMALVVFVLIVLTVLLDRRKSAIKTRPRPRKKTLPARKPGLKKTAPRTTAKTAQQVPTETSLMRQQIVDLVKNDPERVRQAVQRWLREK